MFPGFGSHVRILRSPETEELALAGVEGVVYGFTTPSVTSIEVIGGCIDDFALNVFFADREQDFWFSPELIETIREATEAELAAEFGDEWLSPSRNEDMSAPPPKKWWQFWR